MTSPTAIFISDAHLGILRSGERARQQHLVSFLEELDGSVTDLFMVGDMFDFWMEYRRFVRADLFPTLRALANLVSRGTAVHYVAGNHDFALGPFLTEQVGLTIHDPVFRGTLQGRAFHIQHGDGILSSDVGYRVLRGILRSRLNQRLYKMLHPEIGVRLAGIASSTSRHFNRGPLSTKIIDRYRSVARTMLDSDVDTVVLGHTHTAELLTGDVGTYCNTGEWLTTFNYARLRDGDMTLWRHVPGAADEEIQALAWK